ncbi:MAG: tandem-95 repeat protein, partial [Candidatus Cloacimonadota bacterium]|nr:tandem-95 repeat protein [Candidatus Cloacimonadota bacterium]
TIDTSINLNQIFSDVDLVYGDNLTFNFSGNSKINVEISNGIVTLQPNQNWIGSETLTFTAIDQFYASISDEVIITIDNVNDAPTIELPTTYAFDEDTNPIVDFTEYITDIDPNDNLILSAVNGENISVSIDGFAVTYSATANWNGTEDIEFTINDNAGRAINIDTISVSVEYVNDSPFVENQISDFSFDEDTNNSSINLNTVFADVDLVYGDNLTFNYSGNSNINVEISNGIVTLQPDQNWIGSESITFVTIDQDFATVSDEVVVTINNVNDAPTINLAETYTFLMNTNPQLDYSSFIHDIDPNDNLTLNSFGGEYITTSISGFEVTYSAPQDWIGTEDIIFIVNDNVGRSVDSDTISVTINDEFINNAPFVRYQISDFNFDEDTIDTSLNLNYVFADVDSIYGDNLSFSFSGNTIIEIDITGGAVTLQPNSNWFGSETVTFTATDNDLEAVSDEVVITIDNVNDTPIIELPVTYSFDEDTTPQVDFTNYITDNDPNDNLTLTAVNSANISVSIDGFTVSYSATANWNGTEDVEFTINDNVGRAIGSDTITVSVNFVNDAPTVAFPIADFSFDEDTTDSSINLNTVFADLDLVYDDELAFTFAGNTEIQIEIVEGIVTL